ncbi:nucleotide sugar dehydrogenase [Dethiosulfatarculus sandiegensis]|uniref:UDP-N-acetyl-D-glucosamine dehydrogenase n=1 Tax=Dethiosulfatarculus sandiegensis TaxID=1429043 RepID=A0A0D2HL95_9BACT|nr:nucleotide sugar dehydrogenase [Dethiosulfatarculus sandiegensis]KIX11403.1 UDP-N-acetyl-D-glucosamine dehydrogenase [Dethiosulfatarculus sandiegensis]
MDFKNTLISKLNDKTSLIGVVGMGYVGLPIALRFAEVGIKALGFDVDPVKIDKLNQKQSYIEHISAQKIAKMIEADLFSATGDFKRLADCDVVIIAVPTPLTDKKEPDLKYVVATAETIQKFIRPGQAISLESTTYPGTTKEHLLSRFERADMKVGENYFLIYSPEREDPGNPDFSIHQIPKVVGGITPSCQDVGEAIYGCILDRVVKVTSPEVAELTKVFENIFRCVNIALVNELKMLTDRMGIDVWEVIKASSTKPFGFMPFFPGPGLGGHCIPIDPYYLSWKAKEYDFSTRFIELAGEVNTSVPYWVVQKLSEALNKQKKCMNGSKIMLLGVAYKKNVDDMRESPALVLTKLLLKAGAEVCYHDPYIPVLPHTREFQLDMTSVPLTPENLTKMDAVLIVTDHDNVDYQLVVNHSALVVDTRNALDRLNEKSKNIVKA